MTQYSLTEIEFWLRKVAKASGLEWGLVEEAGKAARWLAGYGLPGPEFVYSHLSGLNEQDYQSYVPDCEQQPWQAGGGLLCPVITGAAVADRSAYMLDGTQFDIGNIAYPLLAVAIVGQAARFHKTVFTLAWADVRFSCFENGIGIEGNREDLMLTQVDALSCYQSEKAKPDQLPSTLAYDINPDTWAKIAALAFETYAPVTDESRAGAGAGLTDND